MIAATTSRPFGKYERFGAYHWREIQPVPTRYNAILTARYRVLLGAIDSGARRVLDIGCGDGTLTFQLAQRLERHLPRGRSSSSGEQRGVYGIDDSLLPLRLAREEFHRRGMTSAPLLSAADARCLPFQDETFDCVALADVIEHIDAADTVIREARRVLRTGGQILLTTPRRQGDRPAHEYHCREYSGGELTELLSSDFSDVRVRAFQPAALVRLYQRNVFGRKLFRVAINCFAIAGWNPLAQSGNLEDEARHMDLLASGRKS